MVGHRQSPEEYKKTLFSVTDTLTLPRGKTVYLVDPLCGHSIIRRTHEPAAAACRAGWLEVADRCRQLVLEHNAAHRLGRHPTVAESLRHPDFAPFLKQLERLCGYEAPSSWPASWGHAK
jgi:hypothetical protein